MNPRQLAYFRRKLLAWKEKLMRERNEAVHHLQKQNAPPDADMLDMASVETEVTLELRALDRERKLIKKIDEALQSIENGGYGYCRETGEPIDLERLEARPIATLSVKAQKRRELRERRQRDED